MKQLIFLMALIVGCASAGRKGSIETKKEKYDFDNAFVIQATGGVWVFEKSGIHAIDKDNMKVLKLEY